MANKKGNTHASLNRKIRQEAMREQIAGYRYIACIHKKLQEDWTEVKVVDGQITVVNLAAEKKGKCEVMLKMLNKVLPDLKSVEALVQHTYERADEMTDDELANIARGSREGTAAPSKRAKEPSSVH